MDSDKKHNKNGAGRKKIYNKAAFMQLEGVKRIHRHLLDSTLTKPERDPITRELLLVKGWLEKQAYLPNDKHHLENEPRPIVKVTANKDIIDQHGDVVKDMIVKGHSLDAIKRKLYEVSRQAVHSKSIEAYRIRYKETDEYKDAYSDYVGGLDSMRIYTKVGRIEELEKLYQIAHDQFTILQTRDAMNQLLKILNQARQESDAPAVYNFKMEQNNMQINGSVTFNLLHRETEKDLFAGLAINEIVLGRIAAKTGVNASLLMKRLHNSYYAKQAGMQGLNAMEHDIKYPSEIMYDIEDMVAKNNQRNAEEAKVVEEADDITEEPSEIKKKLLERIKQKREGKEQ